MEKQKSPQREIVQRLRAIILKTFPNIKEELKMGVPWYEGKYYIGAIKDHVNLGFSVKGLSEQEMALFEGNGKMMRHVKFYSLTDVDQTRVGRWQKKEWAVKKGFCRSCIIWLVQVILIQISCHVLTHELLHYSF